MQKILTYEEVQEKLRPYRGNESSGLKNIIPCSIIFRVGNIVVHQDSHDFTVLNYHNNIYMPLDKFVSIMGGRLETINVAANEISDEQFHVFIANNENYLDNIPSILWNSPTVEEDGDSKPSLYTIKQAPIYIHHEAIIDNLNCDVLKGNNEFYVPMQLLLDAFNAQIGYEEASSNNNAFQIRIIKKAELAADLQDPENYIDLTIYQVERDENNNRHYYGIIHINKDMERKRIWRSDLIITNQFTSPLMVGEERYFRFLSSEPYLSQEDLRIEDNWGSLTGYGMLTGLYGDLGLDFHASLDNHRVIQSSVSIHNISESVIILKPLSLECQIKEVSSFGEKLIASYKIPILEGAMPTNPEGWHTLYFRLPAWDLTDAAGKSVPSGKYKISLVYPENLEYNIEGSNELKILPIADNIRTPVLEFDI